MATRHAEQPVLLERAEELAAIDAVIADTLAGLGRFAVVEGSAGIGKSSLLAEARLRASDAGMTVLTARGSEIERSFSYGVVRQLFERLVAQSDQAERSRLLAGAAAHASRLFSAEQLPGQLRASEDDAFALVHGLYWLALNLAEERPLLISIDDLQWADEASLRWVAYLVRRLEGTAVGVLCAVRPIEDEDPVLAELLADPATTIVRPSALSVAAVTDLVREELSADADEAFCVACHRATGGNPLLLEELIRTVAAEQVAPSAGRSRCWSGLRRMPWRGRSSSGSRGCRRRRPPWPAPWPCSATGPTAGTPPRWRESSAVRWRRRQRSSRGSIFCCPIRRCDSCIRSFETLSTRPARRMSARKSTPRRRPSWRLRELPWSRSQVSCSTPRPRASRTRSRRCGPRHERPRRGGLPAARPDT